MTDEFREMFRQNNFVVLDTETTGLKSPAEVVEIAILDWTGAVLLNTLVRPKLDIPAEAIAVHYITNERVQTAPTWPEIRPKVLEAIHGKDVIVYNAKFDRSMLHSSDDNWSIPHFDYHAVATWYCAMEWYAAHFGEFNRYYNSYRWVRLEEAARRFDVEPSGPPHSAFTDADLTLKLCRAAIAELARIDVLDSTKDLRRTFDRNE